MLNSWVPKYLTWVFILKTTLQVDDELLSEFQERVVKRYGKLKGPQSEALAEAMRLWLSYIGQAKNARVVGGGMDVIQEFDKLPEVARKAFRKGLFERSDITAVPLFFRFRKTDVESLCASFTSMWGEAVRVSGNIDSIETGGGVSYTWQLPNEKKFVLNSFPDTLSFGLRVDEPDFKDLKL